MTDTTKRTALISGASRGLGLALASSLARRGWDLIIDGRNANALARAQEELQALTRVTAIAGDVADHAHRKTLRDAAAHHGGLDALINNASILGASPLPALLEHPLDTLAEVYQINVIAPLGMIQDLRLTFKPGVRVLNITSDAAVEPYPYWGGYGSSKAALEQLSAILAAENPDLRIYWVDPGDMRTQMQQEAYPDEDISDRPLPVTSVPGLLTLLEDDLPSGRYQSRRLAAEVSHGSLAA